MTPAEKEIELFGILSELNTDERGVVFDVALTIARRMFTGRERYGPLDLSTDHRDPVAEAYEEAVDGAAYLAMVRLKMERKTKR